MIPPSISKELATMRAASLREDARSRPRARRIRLVRRAIGTRLVSAGLRMMREVA